MKNKLGYPQDKINVITTITSSSWRWRSPVGDEFRDVVRHAGEQLVSIVLLQHGILVGVTLHHSQFAEIRLERGGLELGRRLVEAAGVEVVERAGDGPLHGLVRDDAVVEGVHEQVEHVQRRRDVGGGELGGGNGEPAGAAAGSAESVRTQ